MGLASELVLELVLVLVLELVLELVSQLCATRHQQPRGPLGGAGQISGSACAHSSVDKSGG